jgi:starch synthase
VASIPKNGTVYFIDNDEYFKEATFADEDGSMFRIMMNVYFFAKGVVETVKLNWVPDDIHVHGWMAAVFIYMKHYYKTKRCFLKQKSLLQSTVSLLKGV